LDIGEVLMDLIDRLKIIDINIFSIILMLIVVFVQRIKKKESYSSRFFRYLCIATIVMLVLDVIPWLIDGLQGPLMFYFVYISNFILFLVHPIPLIIWLSYLDYQLNKSIERIKKKWYYTQPLILSVIIMIYSLFTHYIFYVDPNNVYHRGKGFFIIPVINYIIIAYSIVMVWKNRFSAEKKVLSTAVFFGLIPFTGAIVQMVFYGLSLVWPSVAVAVVFVYIYLEINREIRDYLTGLLNRQQMDEYISLRIHNYTKKQGFTLVMIDMDGFKEINDKYGHDEGDKALIRLAGILQSSIKSIDKVARYGGDEFILLLENDRIENIEHILLRLYTKLQEDNIKSNAPYKLSFSVGYSIFDPAIHKGYQDLLRSADKNMYAVKEAKKKHLTN
jgi:diguanylate cyclase (GGDEF)-like protein